MGKTFRHKIKVPNNDSFETRQYLSKELTEIIREEEKFSTPFSDDLIDVTLNKAERTSEEIMKTELGFDEVLRLLKDLENLTLDGKKFLELKI